MEIYVYDSDLTLCGICDNFSALIWNRKFFSAGDFRITAPATAENTGLFKKHMLLLKDDEVGLITELNMTSDERGENINAYGFLLSNILNNRVLLTPDNDFLTLLDRNIGTLAENSRRIPNLYVDRSLSLPSDYHEELLYSNLGAYAQTICQKNGIGLRTALEHGNRRLRLSAVRGVNRSIEQSQNPRVVFSEDFDNLQGAKYQYSESGVASTVYGYAVIPSGAEYSGSPILKTLGGNNRGYDRIEIAKSVAAKTYNAVVSVIVGYNNLDEPIYRDHYATRVHTANTNLAIDNAIADLPTQPIENFTGSVELKGGYKSDYDLGDIVTILHNRWGLSVSSRICEIIESYHKGEVIIKPIFGSPLPGVKRGWGG